MFLLKLFESKQLYHNYIRNTRVNIFSNMRAPVNIVLENEGPSGQQGWEPMIQIAAPPFESEKPLHSWHIYDIKNGIHYFCILALRTRAHAQLKALNA